MPQSPPGLVRAIVADTNDPTGLGRIRVTYPALDDQAMSGWAPVVSPMAGHERGLFVMPEVGDLALVAFERDDLRYPVILGFLWNQADPPPSREPQERMIRSASGHTIRLMDEPSEARVTIEDASGNRVTLANGRIIISGTAVIELEAPQILLKGPGYSRVVKPSNDPL